MNENITKFVVGTQIDPTSPTLEKVRPEAEVLGAVQDEGFSDNPLGN